MKRGLAIVALCTIGFYTNSFSCSTPVFRYALEMWPAYSFIIEIDHAGALNDKQQKALTLLRNASTSEIPLNITVIENSENNKQDNVLMKISFPKEHNIPGVIWQGPLTEENAHKIINSPSRRLALQLLQKGDAAVWLFLESGEKIRDDKQYSLLEDELKKLSKTLKLSETATDVEGNLLDIKVINTGVNFSSVRIDRNNPMEEIFIAILMRTEPDLQYFEHAAFAFPLFGQGRILYALVGNGIKSKNIETACSTIIGWCSCTIKDDNPGTDLLFAANWDAIVGDSSWIQPVQLPEITGLSGFEDDDLSEELIESDDDMEAESVSSQDSTPLHNVGDDISELPQKKEEASEIAFEPLQLHNETLKSELVEAKQGRLSSPLLRNSFIVFALIIVVITTTVFILKRR